MFRFTLVLVILAGMTSIARAEIKSQEVDYKVGDVTLKGWLYFDDTVKDVRPGIIVFPEWWGINDYSKHRAEMLAGLGYVAFAADMYGDGKVTEDPKVATEWSKIGGDIDLIVARAKAAMDQLKASPHVDGARISAIGYCMGGTVALSLALSGADLTSVVAFHAGLQFKNIDQAGKVKAKILVCTGAADTFVPADMVAKFTEAMQAAGVDLQVISYSGAHHAFTNPNVDKLKIPNIAYNEPADKRSWQAMKDFFGETLPVGK